MLFSKTPDRYCPGQWPPYYDRAFGIEVMTPDGTVYKDFSVMGAGNSVLGYCDDAVDMAVSTAVLRGNVSTLNCEEEVDLAEVMLQLNPQMDMVRFGRSGNDACQIAKRICEEYSRDRNYGAVKGGFGICGYHGWEIGHPPQLDPQAIPFEYGDTETAERIVKYNPAFIMMEPIRGKPVDVTFLKTIREMTEDRDIPLVFDEIASGFRANLGGYHQLTNVNIIPDIVLYGKSIGNNYAISAVVGKKDIMKCALNTFISSMFWSERIGYVAGIATIERMRESDAQTRITAAGAVVKQLWQLAADNAGLEIEVSGLDALATFAFVGDDDRRMITTFTQEMLKRGYLAAGQFYPSICHTSEEIAGYNEHLREVFAGIADGSMVLEGEPARAGFKRLA